MSKTAAARRLEMKFAGGLVKHLGLQMYAGAVPAIAELVSNAWDADAEHVWIEILLDAPLTHDATITVRDDGHGMSFDDVNEQYLVVGRDARRTKGDRSKGKGRPLMARKGIGKLAGFGIANRIVVRSVKCGRLVEFVMDFDEIVKNDKFVDHYEPPVLRDEPTTEADGTTVTLTSVKVTRAIPSAQFSQSMERRFAVYSDKFQVLVNNVPLEKSEAPFQFRFPDGAGTWTEAEVQGGGTIRWWVGFTKEPIADEEARGLTVFARGKLVQAPWFFGQSGGTYGQHGLQYMTGEVQADFLDDAEDLVATDRGSVLWEHPRARALQDWGRAKVRELLETWVRRRTTKRVEHLERKTPFLDRVQKFPKRQREELLKAIHKLADISTIEDERLVELVEFLIRAYENEHFMDVIRQLNAAAPEAQAEVIALLAEWDVLEAVAHAGVVRGRIEVITKFDELLSGNAREKPDLQDFVRDHPWLLDPTWTILAHEQALDTVVEKHIRGRKRTGPRKKEQRRLDFFCLADASRVVVVEVKRPGDRVGKTELRQLADYVDVLKKEAQSSDPQRPGRTVFSGVIVGGTLSDDAVPEAERLQKDGMYFRTWKHLLDTARELHRDFFKIVTLRAPSGDPRIAALGALPERASGPDRKPRRKPIRPAARARTVPRRSHRRARR